MIPLNLHIDVEPFRGMKTAMPEAMRTGLTESGKLWHKTMLQRHFEDSATQRYGYARRSAQYSKRKERIYHHQKPLVYTGRMRGALMRFASIRATVHNVKVEMLGPKWLKGWIAMRGRFRTGPNKAAEITAATNDEIQELGEVAAKRVALMLESARGRRGTP